MKFYVCAPFRGKTETGIRRNIAKAEEYGRYVALLTGMEPIVVHSDTPINSFPDGSPEDDAIVKRNMSMLEECDYLFQCGDRVSSGMKAEIAWATEYNLPIVKLSNAWFYHMRLAMKGLKGMTKK